MNFKIQLNIAFLFAASLAFNTNCFAHSGKTFVAAPVKQEIEIDGDLSDWPETEEYELSVPYIFDGKPNTEDYTGRFRVVCDYDRGALFVGVTILDDDIQLESPVDMWNSRDTCEVFLTLKHSRDEHIPIQFVYRKEPIAAKADKQNAKLGRAFSAMRKQDGNRLVYEWKIDLKSLPGGKGTTERPAVLGFDVGYLDLDENDGVAVYSSSPGTSKHLTSASLGDLMMSPKLESFVSVEGQVKLPTEPEPQTENKLYPPVAIQSTKSPDLFVRVPCNEHGKFFTELPAGEYTASLIDTLQVRVSENDSVAFEVKPDSTTIAPILQMRKLEKPNLIDKQGLLLQEEFDADRVDHFVRSYMKYHHTPGVSLAIISDGKVRYRKNYGVKNAATKEPLETNTLFEACSLTKPIFAFAVNRLVEKGVLDFQTPLYKYKSRVEGYEDVADDARYKSITAQHVLAHRTGFPNWRDDKLTINFEPGKDYGYSGEGFELLGAIVSHLTGKSLVDVVDEEVFAPFRMTNAHLIWNDTVADRKAHGHISGTSPVPRTRNYQPGMAYSLNVDAENYAKFLVAILRREGLKKETYDRMLQQQFEIVDPDDEGEFPYGLGLVVEDTKFGKKYSHGGVNRGWRCHFGIYDKLKSGYVVFTNSDNGDELWKDLGQFLVDGREATEEK